MKAKKKEIQQPQKFAINESVLILRPHLWSGCIGTVVSFKEGQHRIKIIAKQDGSTFSAFHADVPGSLLEEYI